MNDSKQQPVAQTVHVYDDFQSNPCQSPVVEARLAPAALGLSLAAELHRYDTLASSEQHLAGLEATRHAAMAQAESVSVHQLAKAGFFQPLSSAQPEAKQPEISQKQLKVGYILGLLHLK